MADRINFDKKINDSVQVGDELYSSTITPGFCSIDPLTNTTKSLCSDAGGTWTDPVANEPIKAGPLDSNGDPTVSTIDVVREKEIEVDTLVVGLVSSNTFFMFRKPVEENISSLKGYYAEAIFTNPSIEKQELFVVGSEITASSK